MYENIKSAEAGGFPSVASGFFKGVGIAALFTFLAFAVFALILSYTPLPESTIPYIAFVSHAVGAVMSGFIPARKAGTKGLLTGGVSALLYMLVIWLVASLVSDGFYMGRHILTMFAVSLIFGAIGGILGVNFKASDNNKKKR